jgi:glucosylceramidase
MTVLQPYLSAQQGAQRLSPLPELPLQAQSPAAALPEITVDASRRFQTWVGFGGAFTEAAAVSWQQLPPAQQEAALRDYFDGTQGHGYGLCRVHMNSCDFALGNYAHVELAGDVELKSFSIERDRKALLPMIKAAQRIANQPLQILASPWSPPAWMKTNGQMNHGGELLPQYREAWAQCYVRFIQAYAAEGVPIWGITVQNEPMAVQRWDSCIYTAEQERDFVRDFLGPALHKAGLSHVRLLVWDHNRDQMVQRASVIYGDPEAARYVWGMGFHWYGDDHFEQVAQVREAWPDKHLLFTEGCQEGGPHHGSWALGERYARSLIHDLRNGCEGFIDWNLMLDETGGPNHVGNLCSAPLLIDRAKGEVLRQSSYWYLGHFGRFIRPGAQRIVCASGSAKVECVAFRNLDGSIATVLLNRSEQAQGLRLRWNGAFADFALPARAIATLVQAAG